MSIAFIFFPFSFIYTSSTEEYYIYAIYTFHRVNTNVVLSCLICLRVRICGIYKGHWWGCLAASEICATYLTSHIWIIFYVLFYISHAKGMKRLRCSRILNPDCTDTYVCIFLSFLMHICQYVVIVDTHTLYIHACTFK